MASVVALMTEAEREGLLDGDHAAGATLLPGAKNCPSCGYWRWPCQSCLGCTESTHRRTAKGVEIALIIICVLAALIWYGLKG